MTPRFISLGAKIGWYLMSVNNTMTIIQYGVENMSLDLASSQSGTEIFCYIRKEGHNAK